MPSMSPANGSPEARSCCDAGCAWVTSHAERGTIAPMRSTSRPILALLASFAIALAASTTATAQGTQRPLGGGCSGRTTPNISGQLAIGTTLQIDSPACFLGQGGIGAIALGPTLTSPVQVPLRSSPRGVENCLLMVNPGALLDVTTSNFPLVLPIPNVPQLRGVSLGLQTVCRECGFTGCFELLTQGVEVTVG